MQVVRRTKKGRWPKFSTRPGMVASDRKRSNWKHVLGDQGLCEPCGGTNDVKGMAEKQESPHLLTFGPNHEFVLRPAITEEDRLKCWRLVHEEYVARGYATEESLALRYSIHDALPDTLTLLVEKDGEAVGTVTGIPDSPIGLPADAIYREELDSLRKAGRRVLEVGRFAVRHAHRNQRRILTSLMDILTIYARRIWGATDFVITVNPAHVKYYERMLLFQKRGEPRALDSVQGAPAVLLTLDLAVEEAIRRFAHGEGPRPVGCDGHHMVHQYSSNRAQEDAHVVRLRQWLRRPTPDFLCRYFVWLRPLIPQLPQDIRTLFTDWYPGLPDRLAWKHTSAA